MRGEMEHTMSEKKGSQMRGSSDGNCAELILLIKSTANLLITRVKSAAIIK